MDIDVSLKRSNSIYTVKGLNLEVKDVDEVGRRVKVVLNAFDVIDSDRDVIRKGAFAKSIAERGPESTGNRKIAFLRHHDWEQPIGKWLKLEETDKNLVGVAELGRSTVADDAFKDYQDEIINEHSIGFNYVTEKMQLIGEGPQSYWNVQEVNLFEGSAVTFGANELTPTLDVSKGNKVEELVKLNKEIEAICRALKNGKGTDDRLYNLEMRLKVYQAKINSLFNDQPAKDATIIEQPGEQADPAKDAAKAEAAKKDQLKKQVYLNLIGK